MATILMPTKSDQDFHGTAFDGKQNGFHCITKCNDREKIKWYFAILQTGDAIERCF